MMDLLEATEDKIVRKVAGTDRTFKFLTAYDRAELLRADLKQRQESRVIRKAKLIENLKLAEITGEQMYSELETFDDKFPEKVTERDWAIFVNDPLNEVELLTRSLSEYGDEAETIAKQSVIPFADRVKICGLVLVKEEPTETTGPNLSSAPATNQTYWTPEQGNSTGGEPKPL